MRSKRKKQVEKGFFGGRILSVLGCYGLVGLAKRGKNAKKRLEFYECR